MTDDLRQTTLLPLDEPELPPPAPALAPIADELPIVVPEAPEPQLRDEVVPDLPLTAPLPPPPVVPPETPAVQHEVFASALEESRSAVWPLMLALGVGLAVGFAAGYGVGNHDRATPLSTVAAAASPAPPQPAGKEFTESAVNPDSRVPNPESRIPNPEGSLTLHTTPSGAHVMLDGQAAGVTPLVANHVSNGPHRVLISHDGYVTVERRVMITTAQPSLSLTVPLERERVATHGTRPAPAAATATPGTAGRVAGTLSIDSRPTGAKVFLDGKLVGRTPLALPSVSAGEHAVRLERDGYHRWTSSVRIVASEQNRVTASLER
jgi:hypothetical protein